MTSCVSYSDCATSRGVVLADRILIIAGAYLAACSIGFLAFLAGGGVYDYLVNAGSGTTGSVPILADSRALEIELAGMLGVFVMGVLLVAAFALLPALVAIVYAERTGLRSAASHALVGALVGIVAFVVYHLLMTGSVSKAVALFGQESWPDAIIAVPGGAGLVGGMVYWSIAGRTATR